MLFFLRVAHFVLVFAVVSQSSRVDLPCLVSSCVLFLSDFGMQSVYSSCLCSHCSLVGNSHLTEQIDHKTANSVVYSHHCVIIRSLLSKVNTHMLIQELFDRPGDIHRTEDSEESIRWDGFVAGEQIVILAREIREDTWSIEFRVGGRQDARGDLEDSAVAIFSTVIAAIREFVSERSPRTITFAANKTEFGQDTGRAQLYSRLITRFAGSAGYESGFRDHGESRQFILRKQNSNPADD